MDAVDSATLSCLVANIKEYLILGVDFMTRFGYLLDLIQGAITIGGEELILRRGKEPVTRVILFKDTTLPTIRQVITKAGHRCSQRTRNSSGARLRL